MVPGEFLGSPELPPPAFLRKIEEAVSGFAVPPPHHIQVSLPNQLPLYRGPYLVLEQRDKFFRLQIGSKSDAVSVDCLKPAFSEDPIEPALRPVRGRPPSRPRLAVPPEPVVPPPSAPPPEKKRKKKSVVFNLKPLPAVPVRQNPPQEVRRTPSSALSPPFLLGGLLWHL